jgi:hypothetical protein
MFIFAKKKLPMVRFLSLCLFILFTFSQVNSQDLDIEFEKEKKGIVRYFPDATLLKSDGGFFVISYKDKDDISIVRYSSALNIEANNKIKLKMNEKYYYENAYIGKDDKPYLIIWSYDYTKKLKTFKRIEILDNCTLGEIDPKFSITQKVNAKEKGKIIFHYSPDRSQVYMEFKLESKEVFASNIFGLKLIKIDENFDVQKEIKVQVNEKSDYIQYKAIKIANNGNFIFYFKSDNAKYNTNGANIIYVYDPTGKQLNQVVLDKEGSFYTDFLIEPSNNDFYAYGLYSKKKTRNFLNGIAGYKIYGNGDKISSLFQTSFDSKLLDNFMSEEKAAKSEEKGILNEFVLRNLYRDAQGNFILVAEAEDLEVRGLSGAIYQGLYKEMGISNEVMASTNMYNLYYNNVLIVNFNEEGKINWSEGIVKNQYFDKGENNMMMDMLEFKPRPNPSGLISFDDKENVYVLFNDSEANQKYQENVKNFRKKAKEVDNYKKANCYLYTLAKSNGATKKKMIFDGSKNSLYMLPRMTKPIDRSSYLVYAKKNTAEAMGILKLRNVDFNEYVSPKQKEVAKMTGNINSADISTATKTNSTITPSISNTSAIANGQASGNATSASAKVLKYKADDRSVEYYNQLREKFDAEEKIRLEKEAADKIANSKKEEDARQARHLNPDQAPQFDKYRNGATNPVEVKKTAEEDYNRIFK